MQVIILGSSGHGITASRNLPSALIDKSILVDCGEGTLRALFDLNIPIKNIKYIFLTHQHADHFLGITSLIWQLAFYSDEKLESPTIYVPEGMESTIRKIFELTYSTFQNVGFNLKIVELPKSKKEGIKFSAENREYSVKWGTTSHSPLCYAYQFNNLVTFTGDTGAACQNIIDITQNCKVLIHEASFPDDLSERARIVSHSTPSDASQVAKSCSVDQLLLYHIPDLSKKAEKEFIKNAISIFPNIKIAYDKMILTI
jgi:ribonuclease Z